MIGTWNSKFKVLIISGERERNGIRKKNREDYDCLCNVLFLRSLGKDIGVQYTIEVIKQTFKVAENDPKAMQKRKNHFFKQSTKTQQEQQLSVLVEPQPTSFSLFLCPA